MNSDSGLQRWRDLIWRRSLTEAEQEELRAWLLEHPEAAAELDTDFPLNRDLEQLPGATVSSNFTARVMQAIDAEIESARPTRPHSPWWRTFLPRIAIAGLMLLAGISFWYQRSARHQELVTTAREVAASDLIATPELLTDFNTIARLTPPGVLPDESLLAMSEDLIALSQ